MSYFGYLENLRLLEKIHFAWGFSQNIIYDSHSSTIQYIPLLLEVNYVEYCEHWYEKILLYNDIYFLLCVHFCFPSQSLDYIMLSYFWNVLESNIVYICLF